MKRVPIISAGAALVLGLLGGVGLGGCGSGTKTVSATGAAPLITQGSSASSQATQRQSTTTATTTPTTSTPAQTTTSGGTSAPATTRTAPEPAFAEGETTQAEGVDAAAALVRARGYTPNDTSEYHSGQTLRVLVGTKTGSQEGYGQQAFFFVAGHYLGTDTKEPSATVKVLSQSDTEVSLTYTLYRPGDSLSSPTGGETTVHFQLNNGKLAPVGTIPPANSSTGLSRN